MYRFSGHLTRNKLSNTARFTYILKELKTIQNPQVEMEEAINLTVDVSSEERAPGDEETTQGNICESCTLKFESKLYLKAHLEDRSVCFWSLTQRYWHKFAHETQCCSICNEVLTNNRALKRHCFNQTSCKLHYLQFYFKDNKSEKSSVSDRLNTENTVPLASISRRNATPHSSRSLNPSTPVRYNPHSATIRVADATGETSKKWKCDDCPKSYEEKSSLKTHITKIHRNGGHVSTAREAQSKRRKKLNGSSKGFDCGRCRKSGCKRDDFIAHVKKSSACLKYYEKPTNTVPHNLRYCFKCKKNHKNITESENHHCLGVVLNTFDCPVCKQRFHTHKSLGKHVKSKHGSEKS